MGLRIMQCLGCRLMTAWGGQRRWPKRLSPFRYQDLNLGVFENQFNK